MNIRVFLSVAVSGVALHSNLAAESTVASAETLRQRYVEGVRLISETRASVSRANQVLATVEGGADEQAGRIAEMESRLESVKRSVDVLTTEAARRVSSGHNLLLEKARLDERMGVLNRALADDRALLAGATKVVDALVAEAGKSGRPEERNIADEAVKALKDSAANVHQAIDHLARTELQVKLGYTLLAGLQARAGGDAEGIKSLNDDYAKSVVRVSAQRTSIDNVTSSLRRNRDELAAHGNEFSRSVEKFRVAQVAVLRSWLVGGPPEGETPSLTIMDVEEAGYVLRNPRRPESSSTVLGGSGGSARLADEGSQSLSPFSTRSAGKDAESGQVSSEVGKLFRRAVWYFSMLERLNDFVRESLGEANDWCAQVETWRSGLTDASRTLADQRGTLATLQMEQEIVTTTIALIATQGKMAESEVQSATANLAQQTKRLETISVELSQQAGN